MKAWIFQDSRQKKKLGDKCPWSTGWYDPETGKKRSKQMGNKTRAQTYARKLEGDEAAGHLVSIKKKTWKSFVEEYKDKKSPGQSVAYRDAIAGALAHFTRLAAPKMVSKIETKTIDTYIAARRKETTERIGKKIGPRDGKAYKGNPKRTSNRVKKAAAKNLVTPSTINKELRHIKAVLGVAKEWKYLAKVPKFKMEKTPKKKARWVTMENFAKIYEACGTATRPGVADDEYSSAEWWRALLAFLYLTGWRIGETLELAWDQVSLDGATATTLAETNKSDEDVELPLHPAVVDHLRTIIAFGNPENRVFWWPHHARTLWDDFAKIQKAAGIHLECTKRHEHKSSCHRYGFHDFRRGFATLNATKLGGDALQELMRHKSYDTTKKYIDDAHQVENVTDRYAVPEFPTGGDE